MVFRKLLGALGVGGPSVDTVLADEAALPGGELRGEVHLEGGSSDVEIEHITLELVARVEAESAGGEREGGVVFDRAVVGGGFRLAEGERRGVPFTLRLPWETPLTEVHGQPLGVVLGVRTELGVSGAKDKGDLDPLRVRPLPAQEAVLEAFGQLGFGFTSADVELGQISGTGQQLPFYQEIELSPAPRYASAVREVEVTFLAAPGGMEVVLEADRRGGLFSGGYDATNCHRVAYDEVPGTDWNTVVDGWVQQLVEHHAARLGAGQQPGWPGHGAPYGGGPVDKEGFGPGGERRRSGPGVGGMVAAGAAGLAAGALGGYAVAEMLDGDEGGDEGEDSGEEEG